MSLFSKVKEFFTIDKLVYETTMNVYANRHVVNVNDIYKRWEFTAHGKDIKICNTPECRIYHVAQEDRVYAALLEPYLEFFNVHLKLVITGDLLKAYILASDEFKQKYKMNIVDKAGVNRFESWANNTSQPQFECRLHECYRLEFVTTD